MMFRPLNKDYRIWLALIAILPLLICLGFVALLSYYGAHLSAYVWPGITLLIVMLTIISSWVYQHLLNQLLLPLIRVESLISADNSLAPQTFAQLSFSQYSCLYPAPGLHQAETASSATLPQRLTAIMVAEKAKAASDATYAIERQATAERQHRRALQRKLISLEQGLALAEQQGIKLAVQQKAQLEEQQLLGTLVNSSLRNITAYTNLLSGPGSETSLTQQLRATTQQLLFYEAEIGHLQSIPSSCERPQTHSTFVLRDCIDDVIALLQPLLNKQGNELLPVYDDHCHQDLVGDESALKSVIFNYLLTDIRSSTLQASATWLLNISLQRYGSEDNNYRLLLASQLGDEQTTVAPNPRLAELINRVNGEIEGQYLSLPVCVTQKNISQAPAGLTAVVYGRNTRQLLGLSNRLEQLGIRILEQGTTANLCFIGVKDHHEIMSITASLSSGTDVLILNNTRSYSRPNWLIIPQPLRQSVLLQHLTAKYAAPLAHKLSAHKLSPHKLTALVVEDDERAREFLATLLKQAGCNVREAADGIEAIDCALTHAIDLIFMDLQMPRMSGLDAIKNLRKVHDQKLPIIALTAHLIDSEKEAIIAAGANDILIKPLIFDNLSAKLTLWMGGTKRDGNDEAYPSQEIPIYDQDLALTIANQKPDLAIEMLKIFMQTLRPDRDKLNQAISENDLGSMQAIVHRISGASQYCGLPRVQSALNRLETLIKTNPNKDLPQAIFQVQHELNALENWYFRRPSILETPRAS
jgi:CheY-like chemotaxis protein